MGRPSRVQVRTAVDPWENLRRDCRTLTALTASLSLAVYGNLLAGKWVVFYLPWIFKFPKPEIWRIATSFCLTGPDLNILFDTYFRMSSHDVTCDTI